MNLMELITKNDPNVQIQTWAPVIQKWIPYETPQSLFYKITRPRLNLTRWPIKVSRKTIRGLVLSPGMRIVVKKAGKYWPDYAIGKGAFTVRANGVAKISFSIGWGTGNESGDLFGALNFNAGARLSKISVPPVTDKQLDLIIQLPLQEKAKLFLGVHQLLDRNDLYSRCRGNGIEIGPGPKPQIFPDSYTQVKYLEQATPDQWQLLYGMDTKTPIDPALWQHYVVGNADNIPADPGTLDFIFSSHVIEHLANPLGHLVYWVSLLKSGGIIAAVIPDRSGCKDYVFEPSSIEELDAEYRKGSMTPTLAHYQRWAKHRAPNIDPAEIMRAGRSIHVHFYTPNSMNAILKRMYREIGLRNYLVTSEQNHKDFFILLEK